MEGRIRWVYETPCTPYQRLLMSSQIDRQTKRELRRVYKNLNPGALYRRLTELREQLEERSAGKSEGLGKSAYRAVQTSASVSVATPWGPPHEAARRTGGAPPLRPGKALS